MYEYDNPVILFGSDSSGCLTYSQFAKVIYNQNNLCPLEQTLAKGIFDDLMAIRTGSGNFDSKNVNPYHFVLAGMRKLGFNDGLVGDVNYTPNYRESTKLSIIGNIASEIASDEFANKVLTVVNNVKSGSVPIYPCYY